MSGAKTEEPTAARVRKAREEGDSGASFFASQAVGLVVAVTLLPGAIAAVVARVEERLRDAIRQAAATEVSAGFDAALKFPMFTVCGLGISVYSAAGACPMPALNRATA